MAEFISLKAELDETTNMLDIMDSEKHQIRKNVLRAVGNSAARNIRKGYKGLLHKRSGALYKGIKKKMTRSGKAVVITSYARAAGSGYYYAGSHTKGSTIKAKSKDFLTFKIGDKWIRKKEVKLPVRDFIVEPVERYLGSPNVKKDMDRQLQKEIDRMERKAKKG